MDLFPGRYRITITAEKTANTTEQVKKILENKNIRILEMLTKERENISYSIIDTEKQVNDDSINQIKSCRGIIMVRTF